MNVPSVQREGVHGYMCFTMTVAETSLSSYLISPFSTRDFQLFTGNCSQNQKEHSAHTCEAKEKSVIAVSLGLPAIVVHFSPVL